MHTFSITSNAYYPIDQPLVSVDGTLYGVTHSARDSSNGGLYELSTDGSNFEAFAIPRNQGFPVQGEPTSLTYFDSSFYGVVAGQGPAGVVFSLNQTTGFQVAHTYQQSAIGQSMPTLTPVGSELYGTSTFRDDAEPPLQGVVFAMGAGGANYHIIHTFDSNGGPPSGALTQVGNTLYGYTDIATGEIYSMGLDGSNFQVLHQFSPKGDSIGTIPSGLTLVGSKLYGTTTGLVAGSNNSVSTIFSMNLDGSGFTLLHTFSGTDGATADTGLTLLGSTLYGTALGPTFSTIFSLNLDGSGFQVIHTFDSFSGAPGALIALGDTLYGTTHGGGSTGGTVFALTVPEPLSCALAATGGLLLLACRRFLPTAPKRRAR